MIDDSQGFPQLDENAVDRLLAEANADNDGSISFVELFAVIQGASSESVPTPQTENDLLRNRIAVLEAEV